MNEIADIVAAAQTIVIVQADNPDADSLASSLALEDILSELGKSVVMYCGVEIPSYLRYLDGWDRVAHELPKKFDASIIVDTTALTLLASLQKSGELPWLKSKPCIVIDHHTTQSTIGFATVSLHEAAVSTGYLIYRLADASDWNVSTRAADLMSTSILADSLGLTSESVSADSIHVLAELVEHGANLAAIDDLRRTTQKKSAEILKYKGQLLSRVSYAAEQRIAYIHIPWEEIERYSHAYNPSMLAIDEMRMVENVQIAIAFKSYPDGKVTAKIRANYGVRIANTLAEQFGGGGHPYAAGFKVTSGKSYDDIRNSCLDKATELLDTLE